jgi:oligosaccharide repeat unit polymerase
MLNKAIQLIALILLLALYFTGNVPRRMDTGFMVSILSVVGACLFSFLFLRTEKVTDLKHQYIRISYIFLFSFVVVHFQAYIDFLLGNLNQSDNFFWIDKAAVPKSILLAAIGLTSYFFGYSVKSGGRRLPKPTRVVQPYKVVNPNIMFWIGLMSILLFYGTVDSNYLKGNYGLDNIGSTAGYATLIFEGCVYSILIINCRNLLIKRHTKLSFINYVMVQKRAAALLALYLPTMIIIGDRGPVIYLGLGFFFGFIYVTKKKISIVTLLVLMTVTTVSLTIIGLARRMDKGADFSNKVSGAMDNTLSFYPTSFSNNTKELASSVRTLHMAVSNVPEPFPHFNGLFFIQDAMLLVPSLRNVFTKVSDIPQEFTSSSQFLTVLSQGGKSGWGVGTSCIADTYLDFGVYGVVIIYILFGFFTRRMEVIAFSKDMCSIYVLICIFLVFSFCVYIPRSTIAYSLNKFTYVAVLSAVPLLFKKKKKKIVRQIVMSAN